MISQECIDLIKSKVEIVSYISAIVPLCDKGKTHTGHCPFCNKNAFTVFSETQSFYCFGCGAGGDIVTFVKKAHQLDYVSAVKKLAVHAGIPIDAIQASHNSRSALMKDAARYYYAQLKAKPKTSELWERLAQWGLSEKDVTKLGLGYLGQEQQAFLQYMKNQKQYTLNQM